MTDPHYVDRLSRRDANLLSYGFPYDAKTDPTTHHNTIKSSEDEQSNVEISNSADEDFFVSYLTTVFFLFVNDVINFETFMVLYNYEMYYKIFEPEPESIPEQPIPEPIPDLEPIPEPISEPIPELVPEPITELAPEPDSFDVEFILGYRLEKYLDSFKEAEEWLENLIQNGQDKTITVWTRKVDGANNILAQAEIGGDEFWIDIDDLDLIEDNDWMTNLIIHESLHNLGVHHENDNESIMHFYINHANDIGLQARSELVENGYQLYDEIYS